MTRSLTLLALFATCLIARSVPAADSTSTTDSQTLMTERGKLLFSDDFSQPLDNRWRMAKGRWEIVDGTLQGSEIKSDMHGAVARHMMPFENVIIEYSFKLDGAKGTTLSINDAKEHVCRAMISPTRFAVQKDDHDHDGPDKGVLFGTQNIKLEPGQWHTVVIEIYGPEMLGRLDDGPAIFGEHELIATAKANFGFTVAGESVSFRNLRVWEALPSKNWPDAKAKLKAAR